MKHATKNKDAAMQSVPSSIIQEGGFRFARYDIVKFKPSGQKDQSCLFTAQTATGSLLRILSTSASAAGCRKAVSAIVSAGSIAEIDAAFGAMKATVVEDTSAVPSRIDAYGDLESLPPRVLSSILYREGGQQCILPTDMDAADDLLSKSTTTGQKKRTVNKSMLYNFSRMARALGLPREQQQLPDDPVAALKAYEAIEQQYDARKAQDDLEPSNRQISFARAIHKATGAPLDFDMLTGTRSQFSAYISAHREAFERSKDGTK